MTQVLGRRMHCIIHLCNIDIISACSLLVEFFRIISESIDKINWLKAQPADLLPLLYQAGSDFGEAFVHSVHVAPMMHCY